jgi:prolyl oligopeptidase
MVRYERSGMGRMWRSEYGSADDPDEFRWLLGYSPYHAVADGSPYPATLFTVFDNDGRVDPLHARKMCAALQQASVRDGPITLRREPRVGHGRRSQTRMLDLSADMLGFLSRFTGLQPQSTPPCHADASRDRA